MSKKCDKLSMKIIYKDPRQNKFYRFIKLANFESKKGGKHITFRLRFFVPTQPELLLYQLKETKILKCYFY